MTSISQRERPGVVTFVGLLILIQALLATAAGFAALLFRNDSSFQEAVGLDADQLLAVAIAEAIVVLALLAVAFSLLSGSEGARTFVGVVEVIRIGVSGWWILTHHTGGLMSQSVITIGVGIFVLWALYGNEESDAYFSDRLKS